MSDFIHVVLICVTVLLKAVSSEPFFDITDPEFIKECVTEHNMGRINVNPSASNMRYMTWDEGLAVTARAWARFCLFKHNIHLKDAGRVHPTFTSVGENIWAGAPYTHFNVKSAIKSWVDEVQDYDYSQNQCSKVCGHYTQVVWADTYKVGCAAQACPNGVAETSFSTRPGIIFVCNYATAGNYEGVAPYRTGSPCSGCGKETCENKLCRNSTRDAPQSYRWTPDWDPVLSSCGSFCLSVVMIRFISVLLIFASVYYLNCHHNLFAYE
ncbi:GLIPR1-like protein 1 [Rhinichthys klamathensis goyatoka]|uniref:GLIPR1-like protein 1 n=1 Tax=Rhinichthys klamathensis goyatoka TaxID=3034132 RepID=UPI0024B52DC2|nr:GLIPR1-like protein 1 [Rhinichthys klamathensis goyatoka]